VSKLSLLGLLFDPEDGDGMFLQNPRVSPNYRHYNPEDCILVFEFTENHRSTGPCFEPLYVPSSHAFSFLLNFLPYHKIYDWFTPQPPVPVKYTTDGNEQSAILSVPFTLGQITPTRAVYEQVG
jgi:hypothetical protein